MRDIEKRIAEWRQALSAAGCGPDALDELESHLREDAHRMVLAGEPEDRATEAAMARIGPPAADVVAHLDATDTDRFHARDTVAHALGRRGNWGSRHRPRVRGGDRPRCERCTTRPPPALVGWSHSRACVPWRIGHAGAVRVAVGKSGSSDAETRYPMSEERYRLWKLRLLAVFFAGLLVCGWRFSDNGRYVQYDRQRDSMVFGSSAQHGPTQVINTRTGTVREAGKE